MAFVEIVISGKHAYDIQKLKTAVSRTKTTDTNVSIRSIIRDDVTVLRIEGHPESVASAKVKVVEMLEKLENEETKEITLDHKLHKKIIGQNGEQIKQISSKFPDVSINFPPAIKKGDIVTLKGPKQEVDLCCKYLEIFAQDLASDDNDVSDDDYDVSDDDNDDHNKEWS
ncbi:hypothetical protein HELRODRAFT_180767 [Helobdella robusta]|uniref:K Homology domain-containing protein n=1 Tax=Helobdella robusta TaxID=6412 RepID=T1FG92_HELRO|nr:hypothetical protein HELRODRAFT_180767 [Helobdella robusta]ESN93672.1 hypothetical protein HELRODRAFT_180767 [Helobdella robusta]